MTAEFDRGAAVDHALALFLAPGFDPTTLDDIAGACGISVHALSGVFPTKESLVLAVVDDILAAVTEHLSEGERDQNPVDALARAHQAMLSAIIAGTGAVPVQRMQQMGLLTMASPAIAEVVSGRRKEVLAVVLAEHYGTPVDDPLIVRSVSVWSAVIAGTYAAGIGDFADMEPHRDLNDTRRMTRRLDHVIGHITGRRDH